jgi:hypothetical protein
MMKTIKAKFSHGSFIPLDPPPAELVHEGDEVLLAVIPICPASDLILSETAGSWKSLVDAEEMTRNIYADRLVSTRPSASF